MTEPSRILVIDDGGPNRGLLAAVLMGEGRSVVSESGIASGRERAIAGSFDLIVCDAHLADVDGTLLTDQLRAAGVTAPILAHDGHGNLTAGGPSARSPALPVTARPRPRGVLGGLVVVAMAVPFVLQPLGVANAASYLFVAMGTAFLIAYARGQQYVYLIPMVTLLSFGVALLLPTWLVMRPETIEPAFLGILGLGFLMAFVLAPAKRWPLVPAAVLGLVAGARLLTGASLVPAPLEPFLVPAVLAAVGAYLLFERSS
ncbi:MAG: Response regulator receiver domain [Chloroflexota bacterium]|jgi:CheY-like chemotaxis protein|nr:Response regulator receiver domain [Chloroflexota bacterium]